MILFWTAFSLSDQRDRIVPNPRQHADDRNLLESILRFIPGFRGYLEKEYRRESDQLARTWLADRLQRCKRGIDTLTRTLAEGGHLDDLPKYELLRTKLDHLISRFRADVHGYSGFFDFVRVDENLLDAVYAHETALFETTDNLANGIEKLGVPDKSSPETNARLLEDIDRISTQWDQREDLLKGLGD